MLRGTRIETPLDAPTIHTARLTLRPHRLTDADAWYAIQRDPMVLEFLAWPRRTRAESFQHLKDRTRHTRLLQSNDLLALAIERDGRLIGDVSLHLRTVSADVRSAEIGWLLGSAHTGEGIATEAGDAMLDLAFGRLGAHRVYAVIDGRNHKSLALASRLGFAVTHHRDDGNFVLLVTPSLRRRPFPVALPAAPLPRTIAADAPQHSPRLRQAPLR